jgi:protein SCO1/2
VRPWLWLLVLATAIPFVGVGGYLLGRRDGAASRAALPVITNAPVYQLTNQLGQSVASRDFHGKVQLVTFLFPYCTTLCPLIAAHLAALEAMDLRPAGLADKVQIVSFNVDPEGTGPKQMREFLSQYGWDPKDTHWQYLTGSPQDIHRVVQKGFSVWYQRVADSGSDVDDPTQPEVANKLAEKAHVNYDIVHNDVLEIVDEQGRIRKIYDDADMISPSDLAQQVETLLATSG